MSMKNNYLILLFSSLFFLGMVLLTDPKSLAVYLLIFPFIFLFLITYSILEILSNKIFFINNSNNKGRKRIIIVSSSFLISVLLALQTIGQLGIRDIITVIILCAIMIFYVNKASFSS